ncbi:transposase [Collimonas arenae]|uniref:transposase n=1 Tax=Collimonas arenae TaxID=279058 RepID=UPI00068E3AA5|nr:transposase [Collimonas arenae]
MPLTDAEWETLEPLLTGKPGDPGSPAKNNRGFIDALLWFVSGNYAWSDMPPEFGKWNSSYMRFRRWHESGIWHRLSDDLKDVPTLHLVIMKIASKGDEYAAKTLQRSDRKNSRTIFRSARRQLKQDSNISNSAADNSTLHWLSLVGEMCT